MICLVIYGSTNCNNYYTVVGGTPASYIILFYWTFSCFTELCFTVCYWVVFYCMLLSCVLLYITELCFTVCYLVVFYCVLLSCYDIFIRVLMLVKPIHCFHIHITVKTSVTLTRYYEMYLKLEEKLRCMSKLSPVHILYKLKMSMKMYIQETNVYW